MSVTMIPHKLLIILSGVLMVALAVQSGCPTELASRTLRDDSSLQVHEVVAYDPILLRTMLRTLKRSTTAHSRVKFVGECFPLLRMRRSPIAFPNRSLMILEHKLKLLMTLMDSFQNQIKKPVRIFKQARSYIFCLQQ